jgi:hypothetical protein
MGWQDRQEWSEQKKGRAVVIDWEAGEARVSHAREPWGKGGTDYVQVHSRLDELIGTVGRDAAVCAKLYERAKNHGDFRAAYELVVRRRSIHKLNALKEVVRKLRSPPLFVYPRVYNVDDTMADRPSNALPVMTARILRDYVGGEIWSSIKQITVKKRTKLDRLVRLLYQPKFRGYVLPRRGYILVDDVISSGALFASLRSHIVSAGGIVVGMTALAHVSGRDQNLAITDESLINLKAEFSEDIAGYWAKTFGHSIEMLTEQEARFLLGRWRHQNDQIESGSALLGRLRATLSALAKAHTR